MQDQSEQPEVAPAPRLYSLNGVAAATSQSVASIRLDMNRGRLRVVRKPDSTRLFVTAEDLADYVRWIASGETATGQEAGVE